MTQQAPSTESASLPRWRPLSAVDRRVLGVLIEKAKTTPDYYPMSAHAICAGCNQKNNRDPIMQLTQEDVEESLERLRHYGAVGMVEGGGRVIKYRHYGYEWLGVNKVELAVMAELLLRGPQTEGQLRARVSRMEPIAELSQLRTILQDLKQKGLVTSLTPETRGHVVSHTLYPREELERLKASHSTWRLAESGAEVHSGPQAQVSVSQSEAQSPAALSTIPEARPSFGRPVSAGGGESHPLGPELQREMALIHKELGEIREELVSCVAAMRNLEREVVALRRQLEGLI